MQRKIHAIARENESKNTPSIDVLSRILFSIEKWRSNFLSMKNLSGKLYVFQI